jgi:hypothetical protein
MSGQAKTPSARVALLILLVLFVTAGVVSWRVERPMRETPANVSTDARRHAVHSSSMEPGRLEQMGGTQAGATSAVAPVAGSAAPPSERLAARPQPRLEAVFDALHDYRMRFKENPVGTNAEITQALAGANADGVDIIKQTGLPVNAKGELVDEWGTPLFLHQISATDMEIRSAGPDRSFWNQDDVSYP